MKKMLFPFLLLFLGLCGCGEKPAAVVNGVNISEAQVAAVGGDRAQALETCIHQEILRQEAEKRGYQADEEAAQAYVENTRRYFDDLRTSDPSHPDLARLEAEIQASGDSEDAYWEQAKNSYLTSARQTWLQAQIFNELAATLPADEMAALQADPQAALWTYTDKLRADGAYIVTTP